MKILHQVNCTLCYFLFVRICSICDLIWFMLSKLRSFFFQHKLTFVITLPLSLRFFFIIVTSLLKIQFVKNAFKAPFEDRMSANISCNDVIWSCLTYIPCFYIKFYVYVLQIVVCPFVRFLLPMHCVVCSSPIYGF